MRCFNVALDEGAAFQFPHFPHITDGPPFLSGSYSPKPPITEILKTYYRKISKSVSGIQTWGDKTSKLSVKLV